LKKSLFVVWFARFTMMLGMGVLTVVIPIHIFKLHGSPMVLGVTLGAFGAAVTLFQPVMGRLVDVINKKKLVICALMGYALCLILFALTTSIKQFVFVRILQGVMGAAIGPAVLTIVTELAPPQRMGTVMGLYGTSISGGLAIGPLIGGFMVEHFSLTAPLYLCAGLSVLSAILIFLSLRNDNLSAVRTTTRSQRG